MSEQTPVCVLCEKSIKFIPASGFGNRGHWEHSDKSIVDHVPTPKIFKHGYGF